MANFISDQKTNSAAKPVVLNDAGFDSYVKRKYFSFTSVAGMLINDTVQLVDLPPRAVIYGGRIDFGAFGVGATLALGDGTTAGKYLAATAVAAAGQSDFANTAALSGVGSGGEVAAPGFTLTGTFAGANPAAGIKLQGWIDYMVV